MGKLGLGDNTQYNLLVIQIDFSPFSILLYIPMRSINIPLLKSEGGDNHYLFSYSINNDYSQIHIKCCLYERENLVIIAKNYSIKLCIIHRAYA